MTGFDSKRKIALDRLDDDDVQVYAKPPSERPVEADYTSQVAYTRALEIYCDDDDTQTYKKPWVGLTEEEIDKWTPEIHGVIRSIEQALKEKNT